MEIRNKDGKEITQINITNLVDIALTLVIILLMVGPLIEQGIEVSLPETSPYEMKIEKSLIITVAPEDKYFIGDRQVNLGELYSILKEKSKEGVSVIVKGDKRVSYENIIKVLDIVKKCKIELIGLATQTE
ncbi:MAG: biopolymer transporter ExbD [Candidatus Omnitrophica bacterium]|nr:biopolymer transporter ExbD [Candidatus Omnitrophota bacterium]MCM8806835.1 biopolymer transporter ExbD [Candidatus Omnitrophota bacterium]